ncbi:MAG: sigma-70 family RNA polymerase sigma factor [Gemmataceae bacterium]|nr:sigma-70 family RNA polymerase sigma factor [Gemmataceae bacterium]
MTRTLLPAVGRLLADPRPDAALVADFLRDADHGAFAELVRRHGPLVLGACRRTLGHAADADDAFQATFLVLVRRARRVAWRGSLGPWLYGVAVRVARKARAARARRRTVERGAAMTSEPTAVPPEPDDVGAVLDEELAALPEAVRVPLLLCELQGLSRRDAARQLGLAEGTLSSRLARGRKLLRGRLARRGVAPMAGGLCVAVPAELATATAGRAVAVLAGAAGAVPAGILSLTDGVVKTMAVSSWKLSAVVVAVGVGMTGFGAWRADGPGPGVGVAAAADPPAKAAEKPKAAYTVHIREATAPERVVRVPATGADTVHDVVTGLKRRGDLTAGDLAGANLWVARPVPGEKPRTLPVDWVGLTRHGQTATNYQLLAGDRLFVQYGPPAADPPAAGPEPFALDGIEYQIPVAASSPVFHVGFVDGGTVGKEPQPSAPGPVATIFGNVELSRAEFADYLIRRYGAKELEPFVNQRIVRDALGRQGYTVSGDEVTAALDADVKSLGLTRQQFVKDVLRRQGKTEAEWVEDVVVPRLMLAKLCGQRIGPPTEAELRRAFDGKYGEKVEVRVIRWGKDEGDKARAEYEEARASAEAFTRLAGPADRGRSAPVPRTAPHPDPHNPVYALVAKLGPGEVSLLAAYPNGFIAVRCDRVIPADTTKSFEAEKPALVEEVAEAKLNRELPKLFAELKRAAKPEYHLAAPARAKK